MIYFFPMNPKELKDTKKLEELLNDPNWCLQLKRDGVRGQLHILPEGNRVFSRKPGVKDPTKPLEMTHNLPTIAQWKFPKYFQGNVLDVEIYHPQKTAAELSGALNPNRVEEPVSYEKEIEFWCFDIPIYRNKENTFTQKERILLYETLFRPFINNLNLLHTLRFVDTIYEDKVNQLALWLNSGEEGGVLKNLDSLYLFSYIKEGKRSPNTWVKCKKGFEDDFIICGCIPPERLYTGKDPSSWKYWESSNGTRYEGERRASEDEPITKFYYKGWIGALQYGQVITHMEAFQLHYSKYGLNPKIITHRGLSIAILGNTSGMDDNLREKISFNPEKYLYKVAKIAGMEQYKDTFAIRHPRLKGFRWDKSPEECKLNL